MSKDYEQMAALVASGRATLEDMGALGAERVAAIKTNPGIGQIRCRSNGVITKNEEKRSISYLVSDETPDRMGDIIQVGAWDLKHYKENPVVLWAHDAKGVPPIGKATNVRRRYGPERLTADIEYAPKEAHEFADTIYQLASRGFINATSVGFSPTQTKDLDQDERKALGLGSYGQLYTGAELMEISVVAVPANPSALEEGVKALVSEGILRDAAPFMKAFPSTHEEALARIRASCRSFVDFGAFKTAPEAPEPAPEALEPEAASEPEESAVVKDAAPEAAPEAVEPPALETGFLEAMTSLIEQQAEQTRATRQLVDALSDFAVKLRGVDDSGEGGGALAPDATPPDAIALNSENLEKLIEGAGRGFAARIRRELSN